MLVKAAPGLNVPREDNPRKYITDAEPVDIDMTGYYIRRMSAGELVEVAAEPVNPISSEVSARSKK
ncbi:MAG: hypothetical protein Q8N51_12010 [Gammaproteobacteria bacterium]|nr:hypothetical protein [Gammaproteobacteria bacterium]